MKFNSSVFTILMLLAINCSAQFRIVGYLNTWENFPYNASTVDYSKLTYMNIAFANPDENGNLTKLDGLKQVAQNAHTHNVKVLISLGGADLSGTKKNWIKLTQPEHVQAFCDSLLNYVITNKLDGADVDLEGDIIGNNYRNFIHTLAATFHPHNKLVTAAVATWFEDQIPSSTFNDFDFVNIMSYDKTGPWDEAHPGPHSPYNMAVDDLSFWAAKGLPANKTNLGVPFYGWGFYNKESQEEYQYKDLIKQYKSAELKDKVADTIYYNGMITIARKTELAKQKANGIMIWQLTEDAKGQKSLLNVIDKVAHHKTFKAADTLETRNIPLADN